MGPAQVGSKFRFYALDWLRCGAFLLLVWLHAGQMFTAEGWHLHVPWKLEGIDPVLDFFAEWRMPLIFLVSGASLSFSLDRSAPGAFLLRSARRLAGPLLLGMALLIPPVLYWEQLGTQDAVSFFGSYPVYFAELATGRFRWLHLWYLGYLLVFCGVLAVAWRGAAKRFVVFLRGVQFKKSLGTLGLVIGLCAPLCLSERFLRPYYPVRRNFVSDLASVSSFFFTFLYGATWIRNRSFLELLVHYRVLVLGLAIACYAGVVGLAGSESGLWLILVGLNAWLWLMAIVGFATRYLNHKNAWVVEFNRIVFPFYLIHQAVTFVVAQALFPLSGANPWLMYLLVNVLVLGGCLLVIYGGLKRLPTSLQPLVGLRVDDPATRPSGEPRLSQAPAGSALLLGESLAPDEAKKTL